MDKLTTMKEAEERQQNAECQGVLQHRNSEIFIDTFTYGICEHNNKSCANLITNTTYP